MRNKSTLLLALIAGMGISSLAVAGETAKEPLPGREIVFNKSKGNCLACHAIPSDPKAESPGNIAPPLINVKDRYPDRATLRAQIWDSTQSNPKTSMPPFGKHRILTEQEIDQVVDYIQSL